MASVRASLKAAKVAIDDRRYEDALTQVEQVLSLEPNNYHACVNPWSQLIIKCADRAP